MAKNETLERIEPRQRRDADSLLSVLEIAGIQLDANAIRAALDNANPAEFKEVETDVWKPEKPGDTLFGILIAKEKSSFSNEKTGETAHWWLFAVRDPATNAIIPKRMLGSTVVERALANVEPNTPVEIEFTGTEKNREGNGKVHLFKVRVPRK